MTEINKSALLTALSSMLGIKADDASYHTEPLSGGTLGELIKISGEAKTGCSIRQFVLVLKTQRKWERSGDPGSWRREYDLYTADLDAFFSDSFRRPRCYHAELCGDEIQIWMEYIDGISGLNLSGEMYVRAAEELGRFQGKIYAECPEVLQSITNLSDKEYQKNYYLHYRSWDEVYAYIRSGNCEIPEHLCGMLIDFDENADEIWSRIEALPVVFCHRDFWVANIIDSGGKLVLIDWDTTGWGYLGEDIASLLADEADVLHMVEYYQKCVPAYYKSFAEYVDISHISNPCIRELILLMFGYRLVEGYKFAKSPDEKTLHLDTLQKIYEMSDINANS